MTVPLIAPGATVRCAGIVLVRQRPGEGTAIFITLSDETGVCNVVVWERTFAHFRKEVMGARLLQTGVEAIAYDAGTLRVAATGQEVSLDEVARASRQVTGDDFAPGSSRTVTCRGSPPSTILT